jgi:hypothetical protein
VADMRDAPHSPDAPASRPALGEVARDGLSMGSPASVVRLDTMGNVPVALRSLSRWVPLSAATVSPFRSRVLFGGDVRSAASKRSTMGIGEEWRSIAT